MYHTPVREGFRLADGPRLSLFRAPARPTDIRDRLKREDSVSYTEVLLLPSC